MRQRSAALVASFILVVHPEIVYSAEPPTETALIAEYGLRESPEPVSRRPNWRAPKRVVVDIGIPGLLEGLRQSAPDVSFIGAADAAQMANAVRDGAEVAIGRTGFVCDDRVLSAGKQLRWVQTVYAGVERCLPARASFDRGILLTNMRAIGAPIIAEHALGLLFALTRGLHVFTANQATGNWVQDYSAQTQLVVLRGKTMLVVGLGGIGTEIAWRANALGMRIIATRASNTPAPSYVQQLGKPEDLKTLITQADVVVHTAPLTPATQGIYDAAMFARMKRSAYFINVARGGSVITQDLANALTNRQIAGAGLDVVDPEPLPKDNPLWRAPNLVLTPHIAGDSDLGTEAQLRVLRANLRRYIAGEKMLSVVDIDRAY
jgi:phosphoglycerate dehydrogenase-like enzyme